MSVSTRHGGWFSWEVTAGSDGQIVAGSAGSWKLHLTAHSRDWHTSFHLEGQLGLLTGEIILGLKYKVQVAPVSNYTLTSTGSLRGSVNAEWLFQT